MRRMPYEAIRVQGSIPVEDNAGDECFYFVVWQDHCVTVAFCVCVCVCRTAGQLYCSVVSD